MSRTLQWTGAYDDDYSNNLNWYDATDSLNPAASPPQFGDIAIIAFGTVNVTPDYVLGDNLIEIGSTTGVATLVFDNTGTTGLFHPTLASTTLTNSVSGQTTAEQTVIDANGTFVNQGTIIANGPAGSTLVVNVNANGANPGYFINQGDLEADAGDTLEIVVGTNSEILNSGIILANGGSVLITASGSGQIVGGYAPIVGLVGIEDGGTVEFNLGLPYDPTQPSTTTTGPRQDFIFTDDAGDLLKLDQVAQFSGNVLGFEAGDTIDVGVLPTITSYSYNQYGILSLSDASGVVASLDLPGAFDVGTGFGIGGSPGSFIVSVVGGDTLITTSLVNDTWTGDGGDSQWTTADNWSGGVPSATGIAVIGNGTAQTYTVQTGSASVGTLILNDPYATLEVDGPFSVFPGGYDSTIQQIAGTIQFDTGTSTFIYALRQIGADTVLTLQPGSSLLVEGRPSTQLTSGGTIDPSAGGNRFGLAIEGSATVDGATINAGPTQTDGDGGAIYVGQDGAGTPATLTAETDGTSGDAASVTDTYAVVFSSPTSYGSLTITGANTVWTDAGDPSDTENTRGYMAVGDNDQRNNTPTPPYAAAAQLTVSAGATLNEANYAAIGDSVDSSGNVIVDDATWNVGNVGSNYSSGTQNGFLNVGNYGDGSLTIQNAGSVLVGNGGTLVKDGASSTITFAVDIGHQSGATGTLTVDGSGSELTTLGAVIVGDAGTGTFTVEDNGYTAVGGNLNLGGGGGGSNGGTGTLSLQSGGSVEVGAGFALSVWVGATITVDGFSAIDVGGSGTFDDGAIVIDSGSMLRGDGTVDADIVDNNTIYATNDGTHTASTGGLLDITGNVTGTGFAHMAPGATLAIGGTIAATQQITFDTDNGLSQTLILGTPGSGFGNQINNLQDLDSIELAGLTITGASVTTPGTVTVTTTGGDYLLTDVDFAPSASQDFVTGYDATTGNDYIQVTCFAAGTRIATPEGAVPVECLAVGQTVMTVLGGRPKPIAWIGRRRIDCRRHPRPEQVWPVRIRAGAFGSGEPVRDLFLSPDHGVFLEDALIPAKYLVNGTSVAQVVMDTVTYYHIELATHDVVLAEGLPAETYLDTDGRATFDNGRAPVRLHADLSSLLWEAKGCAPLVVTGPTLAAACARLAGSAEAAPLQAA